MSAKPGWLIDGQRRAREPAVQITILDGFGVDLKLLDLPVVLPGTERDWFEATGEWRPTEPMPLEGDS